MLARIIAVRYFLLALIGVFALLAIPYHADFPHLNILQQSGLPQWIYSWANFDGINYINIATGGYGPSEQAFFPLFPLLIKLVSILPFVNGVLAGHIISNTLLMISIYWLYEVLKVWIGDRKAIFGLLLFLAFPTAFYLSAVYTESLFLFLTTGAIYSLHNKKFIPVILFASLSSFARIPGFLLSIYFFFYFYKNQQSFISNFVRIIKSQWVVLFSPSAGLVAYMVYLYYSTGNPLLFLHAQPDFLAGRQTNLILLPQVYWRYIKIFFTADKTFLYLVAVLEFVFATVSILLATYHIWWGFSKKKFLDMSIGMYSIAYIALPAATGTFLSVPRFSLFCFSTYIVISRIKSKNIRYGVLGSFVVLQIFLGALFLQGYFIS